MFFRQKFVLGIAVLILVGGGIFIFVCQLIPDASDSTSSESASQASSMGERIPYAPYNELLSVEDGKTIRNTECNFTFKIPEDWSVRGLLGESKILSPENERENEEWANTHQEMFENVEGDGPIGPDARSLFISCQYDIAENDLKSTSLKTIRIDGWNAYEVSDAGKMPDGTQITNYQIILKGPKTLEIHLGRTEYDDLSDEVKRIIGSISFEGDERNSAK